MVEPRARVVDVTMSPDTSIFASGDIIADTQVITGLCRLKNVACTLWSLTVVDVDDQGAAFDIYFFSANTTLGNENAGPSITDAGLLTCLGKISVATGDYKDLGGARMAQYNNIGMVLKPLTDTQDVYVGIVNGTGTPTYTAAGITLRLGVED